MRPWCKWPILDCGESLEQIPGTIKCLKPHPYYSLGAPYGEGFDPFRLRKEVVRLLLSAQEYLHKKNPEFRLAIFDAWRPINVQAFMVEYVINQECIARGLDRQAKSDSVEVMKMIKEVNRFWAPPSFDPSMPPPHSTGGAVDLTLSSLEGLPLKMGGEIDAIGEISHPNYYSSNNSLVFDPEHVTWNKRRCLLSEVMIANGFVQHPNEWWHFSYGDQLWAWKKNISKAIYGACNPIERSSVTL